MEKIFNTLQAVYDPISPYCEFHMHFSYFFFLKIDSCAKTQHNLDLNRSRGSGCSILLPVLLSFLSLWGGILEFFIAETYPQHKTACISYLLCLLHLGPQ